MAPVERCRPVHGAVNEKSPPCCICLRWYDEKFQPFEVCKNVNAPPSPPIHYSVFKAMTLLHVTLTASVSHSFKERNLSSASSTAVTENSPTAATGRSTLTSTPVTSLTTAKSVAVTNPTRTRARCGST